MKHTIQRGLWAAALLGAAGVALAMPGASGHRHGVAGDGPPAADGGCHQAMASAPDGQRGHAMMGMKGAHRMDGMHRHGDGAQAHRHGSPEAPAEKKPSEPR